MNSQAPNQHHIFRELFLLGINILVLFYVNSFMVSLFKRGWPPCGNDSVYAMAGIVACLFVFTFYSSIYQIDRALKQRSIFIVVPSTLILLNWIVVFFVVGPPFPALEWIIIIPLIGLAFCIHRRCFDCSNLDLRFSWSRIGISVLIGFLLFVLLYPYRGT
jgi:hypothetical protein